jgi:1,5-anhydro-D-fructose reductase (1,5-anhydro-D-mannitol-forming)
MTQRSVGDVVLRTATGEEHLPVDRTNLYEHALAAFHAAIAGRGQPAASGEDGVRSMAVGVAALQSAATRRPAAVEPGL